MSFKDLMQATKSMLAKPKEYKQNDVLKEMETSYLIEIERLIKQINECADEQRHELIKQIKETDQIYLGAKGIEITGHVLFSRHGECDMLRQKKIGLSPNTPISAEAERNMSATNQFTASLLFYAALEKKPYIAISPMNRALQTAGLLIPKGIQGADISVEPALVENSNAPSGFDVRSRKDLITVANQASFWEVLSNWSLFLQKVLFTISTMFYDDKDFEQLYDKRIEAVTNIEAHGNRILGGDETHPDVRQNLNYEGDKIADTQALMEHAEQRDCWFFGHGKNFQAFFSKVLGIESSFDYAETRSVYKVKINEDKPSLFSPPYVMIINQETGKIEGRYTAITGQPIGEQKIVETPQSDDHEAPAVSQAMTGLGAPVSQTSNQSVLEKQKGSNIENTLALHKQDEEEEYSVSRPLLEPKAV